VFDFFAQWFVSSKLDCVVACSHSALFTLRKAKKKGVITILDVSSAHVLLQNELVNAGYKDLQINETYYSNYLIKRDLLEYDIADRILVPSEFVRNSMISHGIPKNKIIKIPYGVDVKFWKRAQTSKELDSSTIRIIFCGHISIQKGIAPLLAAWDEISTGPRAEQFSLSLCGSIDKNVENLVSGYCKQFSNLRYLGKLNKLALRQVFSEHHALILPSLQDGYGMVLNEALSTGLCVMGSCRTGITELPKCDKVVNFGDPSVRNIVASIYSLSEIISAEDKVNLRDWDDYTSELVSELTKLLEVTHRK
jgi:glycosyltransferase involved in cell wall biosynthesis